MSDGLLTSSEQEQDPSEDREEGESLRHRVHDLAHRIIQLADEDEEDVEVADPEICERLALSVKPYIDRLVSLRRLLNPVGRIIEKRDQISELQEGIAQDIASVEDASDDVDSALDPSLLSELQSELAAVKRDRKLFVDDEDTVVDDVEDVVEPDEGARGSVLTLLQRPVEERVRLLLGGRFINLQRLADALDTPMPDEEITAASQRLERFWEGLMAIERFGAHARDNNLPPLRRAFRDYVLVYRTASLLVDDAVTPCTIEALKELFSARFVSASDRSLWYSRLPFYRDSPSEGHWALLDGQYLNCTFRRPKIRLVMYARANGLPTSAVRQKSVLEDVYDRAVVDTALQSLFVHNCNSLTRTSYQQKDERSKKQVFVYYRDAQIRISGKRGAPHWRPGRPRWPGALPAIVFDQRDRA